MEFWNHSHFAKTKKNKRNFIAYNNLTYAKRLQKKKNQRSLPLLSKKRLSVQTTQTQVGSKSPPSTTCFWNWNYVQLSEEKGERERCKSLLKAWKKQKEVRKTPTHFLVPLQFFGDETGTWRVKTSAQTQGDIGQGDDVMYVVSSYPWHGVVGYIGIMIQQI